MRIRNLLIGSSALFAAAVLAGAASAQSADVRIGSNLGLNSSATQTSTLNLNNLNVGANLSGRALSVGNSLNIEAYLTANLSGQAAYYNGSNIGGAHNDNNGSQTATANVSNLFVADDTTVSANAIGGSASIRSFDANVAGNYVAVNSGTQNATLNASAINTGTFSGGSSSIGTALTIDADRNVSLAGGMPIGVNIANQTATTNLSGSTVRGGGSVNASAVGTLLDIEADGFVNATFQSNNGFGDGGYPGAVQTATVNASGSNFGSLTGQANAFGNYASISGAQGVNVNLSLQGRNTPQTATFNLSGSTIGGNLNVGSVAAGNIANITAGTRP